MTIQFERGKEIVSFQKDGENRFYVNVNSSYLQLIPRFTARHAISSFHHKFNGGA